MLWFAPLMAPTLLFHLSSLPCPFLSSLPQLPPLHFPSKFSIPLSKFNPKLKFSSSVSQSLQIPQISPLNEQTLLPFSSEDAQIVYTKCLDLLKLSSVYKDVELARAVHSLILKLDEDNYLSNSLITAYLNLGLLSDACNVFKRITNPDVVSYTAVINGLAKFGYEFEAIELFFRMRDRGIEPNEFTFVAFLSVCSRIYELNLGFQVHSLVVKLGFLYSTYVANALMGLYSKGGSLDDALQLFNEMPKRDDASWNTVTSGCVSGLMYDRALELFHDMGRVDDLIVNHVTVSTLISACTGCSAGILGREVHAYVYKFGFENHLSVSNALIAFYTKCGTAKDVQAVFDRIPIKNVISWTALITALMEFGMVDVAMNTFANMPERNGVSYNAVLTGLGQNRRGLEALSMFNKMVKDGVELTEHTVTSVIRACSLLEEKRISEQVHGFVVKFGLRSNACIEAALLDMCTRCGRMSDAQKMFSSASYGQNFPINWTSLICGFARNAEPEEALALFQLGQLEEVVSVDEVLVTAVLGICGALGFHELGEQMHCYAVKSGFVHDIQLGNALISMYSKCGNMEDAGRVFSSLPVHDVVSWNCLIAGNLLQRQGDEGLVVWHKMQRAFLRPDWITLVLVIACYQYTASCMVDDCRKLFSSMKAVYDIEPSSDHYTSFVSALGNWGFLEEAEKVITKMPFEPKASVWRALLHSCQNPVETMVGKRTAQHILAIKPQDPATYALISNLFSASGRWDCSEIVREEMRSKGLRKHPARSWTILESKVHSFYTRDKSHSQSKDIYRGVEVLILECLKAGYEPNTSFDLHEVEEHQKKDFLFYHSAKLAVANGILMTKPGRPVIVTKNVLLCGDCHNFFKYVSIVTGREILLRDTSGFHRFSSGTCSCRDR